MKLPQEQEFDQVQRGFFLFLVRVSLQAWISRSSLQVGDLWTWLSPTKFENMNENNLKIFPPIDLPNRDLDLEEEKKKKEETSCNSFMRNSFSLISSSISIYNEN